MNWGKALVEEWILLYLSKLRGTILSLLLLSLPQPSNCDYGSRRRGNKKGGGGKRFFGKPKEAEERGKEERVINEGSRYFLIQLAKIPIQRRGMSGYHPSQRGKKVKAKNNPHLTSPPLNPAFSICAFFYCRYPPPAFALFLTKFIAPSSSASLSGKPR